MGRTVVQEKWFSHSGNAEERGGGGSVAGKRRMSSGRINLGKIGFRTLRIG
jgi:hypothetical protein